MWPDQVIWSELSFFLDKSFSESCLYVVLIRVKCVMSPRCLQKQTRRGRIQGEEPQTGQSRSTLGLLVINQLDWSGFNVDPLNPFDLFLHNKEKKYFCTFDKWLVRRHKNKPEAASHSKHFFFLQYLSDKLMSICFFLAKQGNATLGCRLSRTLDLCLTLWLSLSLLCRNIWSQLDSIRAQTWVKIPPGGFCRFGTLLAKLCH